MDGQAALRHSFFRFPPKLLPASENNPTRAGVKTVKTSEHGKQAYRDRPPVNFRTHTRSPFSSGPYHHVHKHTTSKCPYQQKKTSRVPRQKITKDTLPQACETARCAFAEHSATSQQTSHSKHLFLAQRTKGRFELQQEREETFRNSKHCALRTHGE